ncbi:MAG: family 16 glycoside hydrolase [Planctomycetota bacterium]|jgi:acetyl esterase/lipase
MKSKIANPLAKALISILLCSIIFAAETTPDVKTMTYKTIGDRELKIHIHYPPGWKAEDSRPGIIFFFGGGWTGGRVEQFLPQAEYLAGRGMVAARADYRVKSRDGVTPDKCVEDARSAVRWMRKNAGKLGIDPKKLIASGGSAGGHLAACTMIPKSVEADGDDLSISTIPQAMVLFNPVLSFEKQLLLKRLNGDEKLAKKISPTRYLDKNSPPVIILFGTNDRLKIFGDEYWKKARAIGARADEFLAEGQGHGFFNRSPWLERTLIATDKFLTSLGFLKGEPTIEVPKETTADQRRRTHPNTRKWPDLFSEDLSNAIFPEGVWTSEDGVLTASEDQAIWTKKDYDNFVLDLEFKTAPGTNSGVVVYCTDMKNWIPNSVEIQIADDFAEQWAKSPKTWQCGAIFGHLAPTKSMVKRPGQWNRFTIRCLNQKIDVALNGERIASMDMSLWTSAKNNPDGSEIPPWLNKPLAKHPTKGKIGLQGKHAGTPIWFRNIKIREIKQ